MEVRLSKWLRISWAHYSLLRNVFLEFSVIPRNVLNILIENLKKSGLKRQVHTKSEEMWIKFEVFYMIHTGKLGKIVSISLSVWKGRNFAIFFALSGNSEGSFLVLFSKKNDIKLELMNSKIQNFH